MHTWLVEYSDSHTFYIDSTLWQTERNDNLLDIKYNSSKEK